LKWQPRQGPNSKAQGNALGSLTTLKSVALKGRNAVPREASVSPFQGYRGGAARIPRPLAWAFEFGPFGAIRVSVNISCLAPTRATIGPRNSLEPASPFWVVGQQCVADSLVADALAVVTADLRVVS
jgi:hypothetical protein